MTVALRVAIWSSCLVLVTTTAVRAQIQGPYSLLPVDNSGYEKQPAPNAPAAKPQVATQPLPAASGPTPAATAPPGDLIPPPPVPVAPRNSKAIEEQPSPTDVPPLSPAVGDSLPPEAAKFDDKSALLWWEPLVIRPMRDDAKPLPLDLDSLWQNTLYHSETVLAIQETPRIDAENIVRAQADFDPVTFLEMKFKNLNDPVGSALATGGAPRLLDNSWTLSAGMRQKVSTGGQWEANQSLGYQNTNSVFFTPKHQGTGRMNITYTQPLLRGAGWCYNQSFIVLAEIGARTSHDQYIRQVHDQLLQVAKGYWQLYFQRAWLLQQQRHLERAQEIQISLEARRAIDTIESQVVRSRAAIASRQANLARAKAAVRDAEARLRALVNAPEMLQLRGAEMLPVEPPQRDLIVVWEQDSLKSALANRPEVDVALQRIDAARIKLSMSENELLPSLSFVVGGYVAGLEGDSALGQAYLDQFSKGGPGYNSGLIFERALGNRAAQAKYRQQARELSQAGHQFRALVENLATEVEVAVREIATSHQEYLSKCEAVEATNQEVIYLRDRWMKLPGDDRSASLLLEDILQAQDRLVDEERSLAQAVVNYNIALIEWKRTTGNLVKCLAYGENAVPDNVWNSLISSRPKDATRSTLDSSRVTETRPADKRPTPATAARPAAPPVASARPANMRPGPPPTRLQETPRLAHRPSQPANRSFLDVFGPPPVATPRAEPTPAGEPPASASPTTTPKTQTPPYPETRAPIIQTDPLTKPAEPAAPSAPAASTPRRTDVAWPANSSGGTFPSTTPPATNTPAQQR